MIEESNVFLDYITSRRVWKQILSLSIKFWDILEVECLKKGVSRVIGLGSVRVKCYMKETFFS